MRLVEKLSYSAIYKGPCYRSRQFQNCRKIPEAYAEPCQIFKMERFANIING